MCDKVHYDQLDQRVTDLESEVNELRAETRTGFSSVNANIETLSQQLTNMDARLIEEKVKWGDLFRRLVGWTVKALLMTALAAAGVNLASNFIK